MSAPQAASRHRGLTWVIALLMIAATLCLWLWYDRYLRIDFNELGRYHDPETQVVYTDAAFVWGLLAFGLLLGAAVLWVIRHRRLRSVNRP